MPRIVYVLLSGGGIQGGHKMIMRHVETLRDLGFNAVCYIGVQSKIPNWFEHNAPLALGTKLWSDDIVVLPDDADEALRTIAAANFRAVVFAQGIYNFASATFADVDRFPAERFPTFITVGKRVAATLHRAYPEAQIEFVPCFADERVFRPAQTKTDAVAYTPRKRPLESAAIRNLLRKFHPRHSALAWRALDGMTEAQVAQGFGTATLCLSLNRLESVGMTTLEAMASGCVCAGFTGVGGDEYATPDNGFWVRNEYCEDAADALAEAADLVQSGGPALHARLEAGFETARAWSYLVFRDALESAWMRLAPEARVSSAPLA